MFGTVVRVRLFVSTHRREHELHLLLQLAQVVEKWSVRVLGRVAGELGDLGLAVVAKVVRSTVYVLSGCVG
jgi:hypothetical protein